MAIPRNKADLKKEIEENYLKLTSELVTVPESLLTLKDLEGHSKNTFMSINDLLAYLIGWGQLVLKWNLRKDKKQKVDFPETGYKWNELGKLAQKFYKDHEKDNFKALKKKFDKTVKQILILIENKTNKELYETEWYEKYTLGRMIQLNTSSPFKNATTRIRKWKKRNKIN